MARVRARTLAFAVVGLVVIACGRGDSKPSATDSQANAKTKLRTAAELAKIEDPATRSAAAFLEASRVLLHPRCANCHPAGDSPLQGDPPRVHEPPVTRGEADRGVVGMECASCHQEKNQELARVPGAPNWHVAAKSMAWIGKDARGVCEQLKDPARNGGKSLEQIVEHSEHDALVAWGWDPGSGREPAPGSQAVFGELMRTWAESGASCPAEGAKP